MKLQPLTMVTSNVRLVRPLGQGAMGSVWVAEHLTLKTRVAVKFVSERLDPDDPEVMARFAHEASLAAQIKSSHVVQTYDHGVMRDGTPYIVMELLDGEGLGALLERKPQLPLAQVVEIVWQVAKALSSAHKLGIVHRDIKPDNIFLGTRDEELHIKVFDFGIAKHTWQAGAGPASQRLGAGGGAAPSEAANANGALMIGTPEFMSPELVMNANAVDRFADLWALAVVAFQCVTGKRPFAGDDLGELCVTLLEGKFELPSTLRSDVPETLDDWFVQALARERDARYQNVRDMAYALAQAVPGATVATGLRAGGLADELLDTSAGMPRFTEPGTRPQLGATLMGAASDARHVLHRHRSSLTITVAVVAALAAAGVTALVLRPSGDPVVDKPASAVQAAAPASSSSAPAPGETASAEAEDDEADAAGLDGAADGAAPSASDAGLSPRGTGSWPSRPFPATELPRKRKDPGF